MIGNGSLLSDVFIYLLAALLVVPLARRLGLGPVIGYLAAGVIIGPWGLVLINSPATIDLFEHFATLALLFLVAMQATPLRVQSMVREMATTGLWQIAIGTLLIFLIALLIGLPWYQALVSGLALTLSSSTIAQRAFRQRHPNGSELSTAGQRVLLSQSLLLLPIFIALPLLGGVAGVALTPLWLDAFKSLVTVVALSVLASQFLGPALRWVVGTGLDEIFAAFALLLIVSMLLVMELLDLPPELAALLAGFFLVRSEYGSAVNIALRPFQGLVVGLFFISIGLSIDFSEFFRRPAETLALVILLVGVKFQILRVMLRRSRVPRQQRFWLAIVLSQAGELSLIVLAFAGSHRLIPADLQAQLVIVVCLSMLSTPLLLRRALRFERVPAREQVDSGLDADKASRTQVVLAGYGRMGEMLGELLRAEGVAVVAIDNNPERYAAFRRHHLPGYYGDALRPELLQAAGIEHASVLLVVIDDAERAEELVARARREYPGLAIMARARSASHARRLREVGADRVVPELLESTLLLGEEALERLGIGPLEAASRVEAFRDSEAC